MRFSGFGCVMLGVNVMAMRKVRMMGRLFVMSRFVMGGCLRVMMLRVSVVLRRLVVVFRRLF